MGDLDTVLLKYAGLEPWQIWISESQERMTLAVPKKHWTVFRKIMARHDVEATRIGFFTNSGKCVVRFRGKKVMDIALKFLHEGRPIEARKSKKPVVPLRALKSVPQDDLGGALLSVLARPSVGSIAFISEQYDFEVQGTSVTKPMHGKGRVNADAAVIQPLPDSSRGIILAHGYCPLYSAIDTYVMAAAAIDTAVRNAVCAGASRENLAILDNFCWSSSEKPERLYELKRAAEACYDIAVAYGTPFISGKDSMHNDFRGFNEHGQSVRIADLPTLLVSALGIIPDVARAMTIDWKCAGDALYLVGETNDELGASEYAAMLGLSGGHAPKVNVKRNAKVYDAIVKANAQGLVASILGVGRGGLGVALAKQSIAGQMGARVDLSRIPGKARQSDAILFSESQGRILVSVRSTCEKAFEKLLKGIPHARIGEASGTDLSIELPGARVDVPCPSLTDAYRSYFKEW